MTNNGPSAAEDVDIKELLPPSVTLQSLTTAQGVCVSQICQLGVLTSGAQSVITAVVTVNPGVTPGSLITNTAVGFSDTPDPNPNNNQDSAVSIVGPVVNLAVLKTTDVTTIYLQSEITYTLLVTNYGPNAAPTVVVTDDVPAGMEYLRNTLGPDACVAPNVRQVVCTFGPLGANAVAELCAGLLRPLSERPVVQNSVTVCSPGAYDPGDCAQGEVDTPGENRPDPTDIVLRLLQVC